MFLSFSVLAKILAVYRGLLKMAVDAAKIGNSRVSQTRLLTTKLLLADSSGVALQRDGTSEHSTPSTCLKLKYLIPKMSVFA